MHTQQGMTEDQDIERLKIQRMLDLLDATQGDGTSLITLFVPKGGDISKAKKKLVNEEATAAQIKSRV